MSAILIVTIVAKSDGYWSELFATPRFRTGFFIYSFPFVLVGAVLVAVGRWVPNHTDFVVLRRAILGVCLLGFAVACFFMVIFGLEFDWKLSI